VPVERKKRAAAGGGPQTFRSPTAIVIWWIWLLFAVANLVDLAVQGRDHTSLVAGAILVLATGVAYVTAFRPKVIADEAGLTVRNPLRDYRIGWANVTKIDLADLLRVHCDWSNQAGAPAGTKQYTKVIQAWAVRYSRRRQLAAEAKARRPTARSGTRRSFGFASYGGSPDLYGDNRSRGYASAPPPATAEAEAEKVVRVLTEHVTTARAEAVWASGTAEPAGTAGTPGTAKPAGTTDSPGADGPAGPAAADRPETPKTPRQLPNPGWLEPLKAAWSRPAVAALIVPALIVLVAFLA
jgi:Bacterial PH domain